MNNFRKRLGAKIFFIFMIGSISLAGLSYSSSIFFQKDKGLDQMKPFAVTFKDSKNDMSLLIGPPKTKGYRSGFVVLNKGEEMEEHSTERYEEALIILEGKGKSSFKGHPSIPIEEGSILYIPPDTLHSIENTGEGAMKYIYIVAPTR